jgi:TolB-like protein/Flp pilus assembly protein TadD
MGAESSNEVTTATSAVFLSYASQDADAAARISAALRSAGIEVWFDQSELRGGDAWDRQIREQIHDCRLFIALISANTEARDEGYFRREWGLAADRTRDMAEKRAFLIPVVIDDTPERGASVPDKFHQIQWTRLPGGDPSPTFVARVAGLLGVSAPIATANRPPAALPSASPAQTQTRRNLSIVLGLAALAILVGGSWFAVQHSGLRRHADAGVGGQSHPAAAEKSIAVLPFVDLSEKHDQDYFADGIASAILDLLAETPHLTVIGRTSSFQFKGHAEDLRTIGNKLGAAYVVEGSVQKSASRIRITAQLVDALRGAHVWSDTYERDFGDVITLQDEIAAAIARALQVTVSSRDARPLRDAPAAEAYTLYLKGKVALDSFNADSLAAATTLFQQALSLDPSLLPAAEGLALAWMQRGIDEMDIASLEGWQRAQTAAEQARALDHDSVAAHTVLGVLAARRDYNWSVAEQELQRALALNPSDQAAMINLGLILMAQGRNAEALRQIRAAVALDPLNSNAVQNLGVALYFSGDHTGAESLLRKSLTMNSDIDYNHYLLGLIRLSNGDYDTALKEFVMERNHLSQDAGLALAYHATHKHRDSDEALARLVKGGVQLWPYGIATTYAYRGERDEAFNWLQRAYAARDTDLHTFAFGDPLLAPLHTDARWSMLMRKMNLPQ